jgi:thymidine phosphorylase
MARMAGRVGALIHVRLGDRVSAGQPLFTLHAQAPGELAYVLSNVSAQAPLVVIDPA